MAILHFIGRPGICFRFLCPIPGQASDRWRLAPRRANGQPAFGLYRRNEKTGSYDGYSIQVVTFDGDLIADITTFRDPGLLKFFEL